MKPEKWLPITGYEGLYEVSNLGRVRSLDREVWRKSRLGKLYVWVRPGVVMKQFRHAGEIGVKRYRWYWQIKLHDSGVIRNHMVHQLVARAFLGPCPAGLQCRHGPGGMLDNAVTNLSYGTPVENQADRVRDGTANIGSRNPMAKLTEEDVAQIRTNRAAGEIQKNLAKEYNVSPATISQVVKGQTWA